ncbi:hypothetical protein V8E36_004662 [Tilletia maclaganii]
MAYRIEYAASGRAGCKGPKVCKDSGEANKIPKGALRLGTVVEFNGNTSFQWRHWGCISEAQCGNIKSKLEEPTDLDGYEDLRAEDQERVQYMFEHGKLPDADVTPAVKEELDAKEEKAAAKEREKAEKAAAKQKAKEHKAEAKKNSTPKKRKKAAAADDDEEQEVEGTAAETVEEKTPAKKRGRTAKAKKEEVEENEAGPSSTPTKPKRGRAAKKAKAEEADDEEFDSRFASNTPLRPSSLHYAATPTATPSRESTTSRHDSASPRKSTTTTSAFNTPTRSVLPESPPPDPSFARKTPTPSYNAASLLSYLREFLASSPLASGYRGLNGQLRLHTLFSTPSQARDLFPLAHLDLASADTAAGKKQPVDTYLEHILVTVSFSPNKPNPSQTQSTTNQESDSQDRTAANSPAPSSNHDARTQSGAASASQDNPSPSTSHQMTIALECFLYTVPAHRAAVLYVSKLDSTGLGPTCPKTGHIPFIADEIDEVLEGQAAHTMAHPSTTLTRAVTTAFISYFASFQHWLPFSAFPSTQTSQHPFGFSSRFDKILAARRVALKQSPVRHLSVHVLARAQRCYLFPDSDLNPVKRVLSDGGLIKWWRRTLSDSIFASQFEHVRACNDSNGSQSESYKLSISPFYLMPGYSKYESHPLVPLPAVSTPTHLSVTDPLSPRKPTLSTGLHPSWPNPPPPTATATSSSSFNASNAASDQDTSREGLSTRGLEAEGAPTPVYGRSISPLWERLGKLDERGSVGDAQWTYGHPYSSQTAILPLYHPVRSTSVSTAGDKTSATSPYDTDASSRGWRSIATLLPHFEDDPKSRFVDEIARDAHEHGGPSLARAVAAATAKAKVSVSLRDSQTANGLTPPPASELSSPSKSRLASPIGGKGSVVNTRKVASAASDAGGSPSKPSSKAPAGIQSVAQSSEASQGPAPSLLRRNAALRNQIIERAALDQISADEFWERMGFRQECCSGNVVGVFVILFTLEDARPSRRPSQRPAAELPPATPPVAQPLSLPNPSIRDMVLKNIMRDACDWSNGASAEKLTQSWGEAVHKAVMRKGNVRKYLATGEGGSDVSSATLAAAGKGKSAAAAVDSAKAGSSSTSPLKTVTTPVRSSVRLANRESPSPAAMRTPEVHAMGTRSRTASLARQLENSGSEMGPGADMTDAKSSSTAMEDTGPTPTLQDAPADEPAWVGYNTIWTTVSLHGPPPAVVQRAEQKLKNAIAEAETQAKLAFAEMQRQRGGDMQIDQGAGAGSVVGAARPAQPVTMLAVKKKKQPEAEQ